MKMIIALGIVLTINIYAQNPNPKSPFISLIGGGTITFHEDFTEDYDSKIGLSYGFNFGFPLSTKLFLYTKATYFSTSGVPTAYRMNYYDSASFSWVPMSQKKDGSASYSQWFINVGLLYTYEFSTEYIFSIAGGFTYTRIRETRSSNYGWVEYPASGNGLLGYFGGAGLEKRFIDTPFSIFSEYQINISIKDIKYIKGDYGASNLNVGLRYYFDNDQY